ncbi:MAG: class I SAM-dependent DNA methyltransferase [Pseudomonadota bacterium]|nr:class I SAM-dependent DNA methyltransferase [Pseudomonadota bacterium]
MDVQQFITLWSASGASERANKDSFLKDLCDVLGVPHPAPCTGHRERDLYVFEADSVVSHEGGAVSIGKMDLYKAGCFVLEAKQGSNAGAAKVGTAKRNTPTWALAMQDAYGQAFNYARTLAKPPPFLVVADIGYCFDLYACFDETRIYRPFPDGQSSRLFLADLPRHRETLRAVWTDPYNLDPARQKARVTRKIAGHIAELASALEDAGHRSEVVAKFLMRALFTMFAEDVGLLPEGLFTRALEDRWCKEPSAFPSEVEALWATMNTGGSLFLAGRILRFNGGLFADPKALALDAGQLRTLHAAAKCSWADVEPAIFGTLLERALDERERHALGAHYTPRAYVERLVRPTIEEPLRREWDDVRVEARLLAGTGKLDDAREAVGRFHRQLCTLKVLDPACGTGNFLYVALDTFKRVESEVLALLSELGDTQALLGPRVSPAQFLGIEVKAWAREIAELVLWIGHLSWNARIYGKAAAREPVLQDHGNIKCHDAILVWDTVEPVLDDAGAQVTRWDGVSKRPHAVTGKLVPDETKQVPVVRYVNPRIPAWPPADFVVGNPPYIGAGLMRTDLGDGYVEALRAVHTEVPDSADLVMYFWDRAARLVKSRALVRFGFITTKAITQSFNRRVLEAHMGGDDGVSIVYAIPNHPWPGDADSAAVRVAMTVAERGALEGTLDTVMTEREVAGSAPEVTLSSRRGVLHADLKIGPNLTVARRLRANQGLSSPGVKLHGAGFIVTPEQAKQLGLGRVPGLERHILDYRNGKDLAQRGRGVMVIDLHGLGVDEVRTRFPEVYQWVLERVKPERDQNNEAYRRENWWLFGRKNTDLRASIAGLPRYITTVETAKHRWFTFLDASIRPDNKLINFGLSDAYFLGVLSSRVHVTWALATGGRLGVGDDPVYAKTTCFDCFPFPEPVPAVRERIRVVAERLDAHRKARQELHPDLTITALYNVLEKLRAGEDLSDKEHGVHDRGLVAILRELHDELDAAVLDAYGWEQNVDDDAILWELVALNAARHAEERRNVVRWLRPEFQHPSAVASTETLALPGMAAPVTVEEDVALAKWPTTLSDRVTAVREALDRTGEALGVEQVARRFKGARRADVEAILDSLSALGIAVALDAGKGRRWVRVRAAA